MAQEADIDAYFERTGFAGSIAPSPETLSLLHQLHPAAIPFENLDPLMGAPVRLDLTNLQQKLLFDRRGGYCLEHNLLFKAVLESLDFPVKAYGARVHWGHGDDDERPVSHLVLAVEAGGSNYLADVGFGGLTLTAPLRLRADVEQATPHETYRLRREEPDWRLEVKLGEDWRLLYKFAPVELSGDAIGKMNELVSHDSRFRDNLIGARTEKGQRLALDNLKFTTHVTGGPSESRMLGSVAELREVLAGSFGIALPAAERLDPALQRLIERAATADPG